MAEKVQTQLMRLFLGFHKPFASKMTNVFSAAVGIVVPRKKQLPNFGKG